MGAGAGAQAVCSPPGAPRHELALQRWALASQERVSQVQPIMTAVRRLFASDMREGIISRAGVFADCGAHPERYIIPTPKGL